MPPNDPIADELTVIDAIRGDQAALDRLVQRWRGPIVRTIRRTVGRGIPLAEIEQDAWLSITRNLRRLDDPARFPGWALSIARRRSIDAIRSRQSDRSRRDAIRIHAATEPPGPDAPSPSAASDRDDEIAALRHAIASLPPADRELVSLHYAEGLALASIAEILEIPVGTVKSRLHAARERLRNSLTKSPQSHTRSPS